MANINLLPWREERRRELKKEFLVMLAAVVLAAVLALLLMNRIVNAAIDNQNGRNQYLQNNINELNRQVAEIQDLEKKRRELLDRMKIIQDLQGNRPIIGRVFDQLVRTLPDGVYFTSVKMTGKNIAILGAAESNNRVSNLMRNLDGSEWLEAPNLTQVKATTSGALDQANVFQLSVQQTQPAAEVVEGEKK